jgi:uncharacterized metal-binding protein YceD (DUF177 family)
MTEPPLPFSLSFDLASLGDAEKTVTLAPSAEERAAIAAWAGIDGVVSFSASVRLRREGADTYALDASFTADVVQSCVVTLASVPSHLEGTVSRAFRVMPHRGRRHAPPEELEEGGDDETEVLTGGHVDLALPVLEEFLLAIDPYPRVPGAVFEAPSDPDKPVNPFAVLEKLKGKP